MLESMASKSSFEIQGLAKKPYPFQLAGIEFAIEHKRVLIGDQMGLGKTIQAIGVVTHMQLYPAIVVCPAIVKLNWERELNAWIDGPRQTFILNGEPKPKIIESLLSLGLFDTQKRQKSFQKKKYIVRTTNLPNIESFAAEMPITFFGSGIEVAPQRSQPLNQSNIGIGNSYLDVAVDILGRGHINTTFSINNSGKITEISSGQSIQIESDWRKQHAHYLAENPKIIPKKYVIIVNYDIVPQWLEFVKSISPQIVIFDEIHYAKTGTSHRGRASRELSKDVPYVLGLSGTPILNRPAELVNPLRILQRLEELGGRAYFERRYCEAGKDNFGRWNISGAAHLKELNDRLRSTGILIRRLKKDVLADLPRKLPPAIIPIELTNRQEYTRAEHNLAKWLGERASEDQAFKQSISHLTPINQIKAISLRRSRAEFRARKNEERLKFIALKKLSTEGKLAGVKEHVNNFLLSGEKLVLFGWFVDTQRDLVVEWPHAAHALGPDSQKQRQEAIDAFQNTDVQLLVCSLSAVGIGVNLTAAHHVAFVELGWTPADHDQAEDRLHRIGQEFPVNVYYYVGVGTIEEDIIDIIDRKRKIIGPAVDGIPTTHEDIQNVLIGKLLAKWKVNTNTQNRSDGTLGLPSGD